MSSLIQLYDLRHQSGQKRQPRHAKALRGLHKIVSKKGHPYVFDRDLNAKLMVRNSYTGGSRGYLCKPSGDTFLYRLAGIKELANDKTVKWTSHIKAAQPPERLFRLVKEDCKRVGDWVPLNRYAQGKLSGYRNITFWTTHPLLPTTIVSDGHLIGLTNNWFKEWSVIMRFRVKDLAGLSSVRVPTVLDAFTELIFYPTNDRPKPSSGVTISLTTTGPLSSGVTEFVLSPIEVNKMQIIPCSINNKSLPCIHSKDVALWDLLEAFYSNL